MELRTGHPPGPGDGFQQGHNFPKDLLCGLQEEEVSLLIGSKAMKMYTGTAGPALPFQAENEASDHRGAKLRAGERDRALPTLLESLGPAMPEAHTALPINSLFHISWVLVTDDRKSLLTWKQRLNM